ncbi:hypothetical protein A6456_09295 [Paraburkholderia tropica]|nr:thioesterase family protein [Paraburkholderia tropica]OBR53147.1 hypothetical protein A6456_09295 [Paraburkholderia tropica]
MNGHISHTAIAPWLEQGRFSWLETMDVKDVWFIVARIELDFCREMYFGTEVIVRTRLLSRGNTSVSLSQDVCQGDEVCVRAKVVLVNIDRTSKTPRKLSDTVSV